MFLKRITLLLLLAILLCGCSSYIWVGDGRGDWSIELCNGYSIDRINSREILFVHKETPTDVSNDIVISNYFITSYFTDNHYIMLEGIKTNELCISDDELSVRVLSYYLVNTVDKDITGPFDTKEELSVYCNSLDSLSDEWIAVDP